MKKIILAVLILVCLANLKAQQSLTLYNMEAIPQAMYVNPSVMPLTNINIGLPGISSNYLNYGNNGFVLHDLLKQDPTNGGMLIDANSFLGKLKTNNDININAHVDLLSFGFKVKKKNYFSFNLTERVDVRFSYTKDLMSFVINGNGAAANLNRDMHLAPGLDASHYREWGLNYTREVNDKLTIGGRLKYLSGIENVNTEKSSATLNTNSQYYALTGSANVSVNTAGVDSASQKNTGSILGFTPSRQNRGAAIDLAASYKYSKKLSFSLSIVDLGFINWKQYTTNYVSNNPNATVHYNGVNVNQAINDSANFGKSTQNYGDSLSKAFGVSTKHTSYTTMLTTQFYLGANYWLNEKNNVGLLLNGRYANKQFNPALCVSFNNKVGRWFSASLSYSMLNRSYDNVGLGLAFTGPVQFYVVSDNILSFLVFDKYKSDNSSFVVPAYSKNLNLRVGINITIGKIPKDKDKDGVPDKVDDCPLVAGVVALKGCPDRDGDSIPDKDDACPDVAGLKALKGCPDRDGDGIADKDDKCPDDKGLVEFDGCPDRDGDKIIDKDDECPDEAGLAEFMGCPDRDADGTPDKYDACPDVAGPKELKGCPDKDGDKVIDKDDACPDVPGPIENKGCPLSKLDLVDKNGSVIATSTKTQEGWYTFDNIPSEEEDAFKLEVDDASISAIVIDYKGNKKDAIRRADGLYHFLVEIKAAEKKILEKAFSSLQFATGKDIIKPVSYPSLNQLATLMKQHADDWMLKLSGHTDNQGGAEANMLLSEKRAKAVKKYLVSKGVKEDKIVAEWFGQTQPIESNATEAGRQKNRRVEMKVLYK
jgi:outer membrane protein OmpA-like peptidoglycan-associated protein